MHCPFNTIIGVAAGGLALASLQVVSAAPSSSSSSSFSSDHAVTNPKALIARAQLLAPPGLEVISAMHHPEKRGHTLTWYGRSNSTTTLDNDYDSDSDYDTDYDSNDEQDLTARPRPRALSKTPKLPKLACGSNELVCDTKHRGRTFLCRDLVQTYLMPMIYNHPLPKKPRSVCLTVEAGGSVAEEIGRCCISWSKPVKGRATYEDLAESAKKVLYNCQYRDDIGYWTGGRTQRTRIGHTCMDQCLSSQPDDCH